MQALPAGGHTVRGLLWMTTSLLAFLILLLGSLAVLLALAPWVLDATAGAAAGGDLAQSLGFLSIVWAFLAAAVGAAFVVGFADLHSGGQERGLEQARAMDQAAVYFVLAALLWIPGLLLPSITWPQFAVPWLESPPAAWARVAGVALPGFRALFGGLGLFYATAAIAEEAVRVRLLLAMSLGVVGAFLGPGILLAAAQIGGSPEGLLGDYLLAALVGGGLSALSLGIFVQVYRNLLRGLRSEGPSSART